jgi:type IV pilus assembly protein PilW
MILNVRQHRPRLVSGTASVKTKSTLGGFSLIELMIAMVIGLGMMAIVTKLFVDVNRSNQEMAQTNEQMESGRFSLQIIANDIVHGGFWNGYVPQFDDLTYTGAPTDIPAAIPEPCLAYASWNNAYKTGLLAIPVQTYSSVPTGCSAVVTNHKADTDVIVVRHADTCTLGTANCEADTSASANPKIYFQASWCGDTAASAYAYTLATNNFVQLKRSCTAGDFAEKRKYISTIYYVNTDRQLMRAELGGAGGTEWSKQALIEGVDSLVAELGVDSISDNGTNILLGSPKNYTQAISWADTSNKNSPTNRGDGAPDGDFVRCTTASPCDVHQLVNVVAVKLHVLVRNKTATADYKDEKTYQLGSVNLEPFEDNFKRHVYSTTVRLHNVSARRETP